MSGNIIPPTSAQTQYEQLTDSEGHLLLIPSATAQFLRSQGRTTLDVLIYLAPAAEVEPWLTVTEAAKLVVEEEIVFGWTIDKAKVYISRDCKSGKIRHDGEGPQRRIDPASFRAWMFERRRDDDKNDE